MKICGAGLSGAAPLLFSSVLQGQARGAEGGQHNERSECAHRLLSSAYCSIRTSIGRSRFGLQCRDQLGSGEDFMGVGRPIEFVRGVHHFRRKGGRRICD
jgi:hypothetical protein